MKSSSPEGGDTRSLRRLEVFLDVLYALIVFRMLAYLPSAEDMTWVGGRLGLLGALIHNPRNLWRLVMGIGLTVICWTLNNKRLNRWAVNSRPKIQLVERPITSVSVNPRALRLPPECRF